MKSQKTLMRHLRRAREISLDEVCAKTGINVSTISRIERRLISGTTDQRKTLAKFFKVSEAALLEDADTVAA